MTVDLGVMDVEDVRRLRDCLARNAPSIGEVGGHEHAQLQAFLNHRLAMAGRPQRASERPLVSERSFDRASRWTRPWRAPRAS